MAATLDDARYLRQAFALAQESREKGNHPFATVIVGADGTLLATGQNDWHRDPTAHAEMNAIRAAAQKFDAATLAGATLYTNAEPCAMCAGGVYWSGIGRVVYGLSEANLLALTGAHPENPTLSLPCREVFARGQRPIEVIGPLLEDEARIAHRGFWGKPSK
jgi:tRNA(Arg) A34 adenosine deaminase TadA